MPPAYPCPACGSLVLADAPGSYALCSVCDWEDDALQLANPTSGGGANHCSLVEAQASPRDHAPGVPRDPAWRPVSEQEIAWHRAECVEAGTPLPNPATGVYYWRHPFERVYSTPDWYDGPVSGVADYQGRPHRFSRRWDEGDEPELYDLEPVSERERDLEVQLWRSGSGGGRRTMPGGRRSRPIRASPRIAMRDALWRRSSPGSHGERAARWSRLRRSAETPSAAPTDGCSGFRSATRTLARAESAGVLARGGRAPQRALRSRRGAAGASEPIYRQSLSVSRARAAAPPARWCPHRAPSR